MNHRVLLIAGLSLFLISESSYGQARSYYNQRESRNHQSGKKSVLVLKRNAQVSDQNVPPKSQQTKSSAAEFNPLEIMDATPIGSAAIPPVPRASTQQHGPQPTPAIPKNIQRTPERFIQTPGNFAVARLSDQPTSLGRHEGNSHDTVKTNPNAAVGSTGSRLTTTSHFAIAALEAKIAGPLTLSAGEYGQYRIDIRNVSPAMAADTELFIELPRGCSIKTDKSLKPRQSKNGISFFLGNLRPNQPIAIPFKMALPHDGSVEVTAYLRHSGSTKLAVDVASNQSSPTVRIHGSKQAQLGETLTYALVVENTTARSGELLVYAKLPNGLRLAVLDRQADYDAKTGEVAWSVPSMQPGESETIRFKAKVVSGGDLTITANAFHAESKEK